MIVIDLSAAAGPPREFVVAKKAAAKRSPSKKKTTKAASRKSPSKKAPAKAAAPKKSPSKSSTAAASSKKKVTKKASTSKKPASKPSTKKTTKKAASSKAPAAKKPTTKKSTTKKTTTRKSTKAPARKPSKTPESKTAAKESASTKKAPARKPSKKAATEAKSTERKPSNKKAPARKPSSKPAASKPAKPSKASIKERWKGSFESDMSSSLDAATRLAAAAGLRPLHERQTAAAANEDYERLTKTPYKKRELDRFKEILRLKRAQVTGDVNDMETEALIGRGSGSLSKLPQHMADAGSDTYDQTLNLDLAAGQRKLLKEIDDALARIENKTYGICELLGKPIKKERLENTPWARYSIEAARRMEMFGS